MKKYIRPQVEIIDIETEGVIALSGVDGTADFNSSVSSGSTGEALKSRSRQMWEDYESR